MGFISSSALLGGFGLGYGGAVSLVLVPWAGNLVVRLARRESFLGLLDLRMSVVDILLSLFSVRPDTLRQI